MTRNRSITGFAAAAVLVGMSAIPAGASDQSPEKWEIVYIGTSWLPEATRLFGEDIEADLGVDVTLGQRNEGDVGFAARKLRDGQWDIVKDAEVIVVSIYETTRTPGYCTDASGDTPFRVPPERFRADIDAFLSELTRLANPETTLIRLSTQAVLPHFRELWAERGVEADCVAAWIELNDQWRAGAAAYGIPVVDVQAAWNGPDGKIEAPREYFVDDGGHLSPEGARAAADLMRETGYAPRAP
jgi:hypothetical protein